jgi:hypothetical protein
MAISVTTGQIGFQAPITDNSFTTSKGANSIAAGDLLMIACGVGDQTGASVDPGAFAKAASL